MDFGIGRPQVLLIRAALSPDKAEAAAALDAWWKDIPDFEAVRGSDAGLFPRIYWNLGSSIRDPQLRTRLKGTARHHWLRNQYLIATCGKLLDLFGSASIPVLLLKGAAIATTIDEDPGLRSMSDCDLLVPRSRAPEAIELLSRAGLLLPSTVRGRDLKIAHGIGLDLGRQRVACDIHWRPVRAIGAEELGDELFSTARSVQFTGRPCVAPCPEHMVFHAIVHGVEWSPFPRYEWLIDTANILLRIKAAFDWDRLTNLANRYGFGALVGGALETARDAAGVPVPGSALRRLRRPLAVLERVEFRIRLSKRSALSIADELVLGLQSIRRREVKYLGRSALHAIPTLMQSFWGPLSAKRSFIQGDDREPVTFLQGWSTPEPGGRWTEGKLVSCALYAPGQTRPTSLMLRGRPFAHGATAAHAVDVFAGWRKLGTLRWRRSGGGPAVQQIALPAAIWRGETAVIRFHVRSPVCPIETGLNGDTRAVGVFVTHLATEPAFRDVEARPLDFSSSGPDIDVLWHGWSWPEQHGCWTDGKLAVMRWRAARDLLSGSILSFEFSAMSGVTQSKGQILADGAPAGWFDIAAAAQGSTVECPLLRTIPAGQALEITLAISREPLPRPGAAHDRRGLSLVRISIKPSTT